MQESKSCALPLGYTPMKLTLELYHKIMLMSREKEEKIQKSGKVQQEERINGNTSLSFGGRFLFDFPRILG